MDSLRRAVEAIRWTPRSAWAGYYAEQPSYEQEAFDRKRQIVGDWLRDLRPALVWDLGANTGVFSRIAADAGASVVAFDSDPACVDVMYRDAVQRGSESLLPLVYDLVNPSPAIGWANQERMTLEQRGPADLVLALALVHHLAVANNVPLPDVLAYVARLGRRAIVEFVPRADAMVRQMMAGREQAFDHYSEETFAQACAAAFQVEARVPLPPSGRVLYRLAPRG